MGQIYRKIPIIIPGLIFVQKAFLLGLSSGELIFGGAYFRKEFCVSKWVWLVNKSSQKHSDNSLNSSKQLTVKVHGLIFGRAYTEGFLRLRFGGLIFGRAYFGGGGGLIIGILRYHIS